MDNEGEKQGKLSIYLSEDTRARFKAACAIRKVSMNGILVDFIESWLKENAPQFQPQPEPETSLKEENKATTRRKTSKKS